MGTRIAINGFGRIGRNFLRALLAGEHDNLEVVAVNDLTDPEALAHLIKYDTVQGILPVPVKGFADRLEVGGQTLQVLSEPDPAKLPWRDLNIDIVIEATG